MRFAANYHLNHFIETHQNENLSNEKCIYLFKFQKYLSEHELDKN